MAWPSVNCPSFGPAMGRGDAGIPRTSFTDAERSTSVGAREDLRPAEQGPAQARGQGRSPGRPTAPPLAGGWLVARLVRAPAQRPLAGLDGAVGKSAPRNPHRREQSTRRSFRRRLGQGRPAVRRRATSRRKERFQGALAGGCFRSSEAAAQALGLLGDSANGNLGLFLGRMARASERTARVWVEGVMAVPFSIADEASRAGARATAGAAEGRGQAATRGELPGAHPARNPSQRAALRASFPGGEAPAGDAPAPAAPGRILKRIPVAGRLGGGLRPTAAQGRRSGARPPTPQGLRGTRREAPQAGLGGRSRCGTCGPSRFRPGAVAGGGAGRCEGKLGTRLTGPQNAPFGTQVDRAGR